MIEEKFFGIDERPKNIFISLTLARQALFIIFSRTLFIEVTERDVEFALFRLAGKGAQIKIRDLLLVGITTVGSKLRRVTFVRTDFVLDFLRVQKMKALGQTGALRTLAFAGGRTFRTAKDG